MDDKKLVYLIDYLLKKVKKLRIKRKELMSEIETLTYIRQIRDYKEHQKQLENELDNLRDIIKFLHKSIRNQSVWHDYKR